MLYTVHQIRLIVLTSMRSWKMHLARKKRENKCICQNKCYNRKIAMKNFRKNLKQKLQFFHFNWFFVKIIIVSMYWRNNIIWNSTNRKHPLYHSPRGSRHFKRNVFWLKSKLSHEGQGWWDGYWTLFLVHSRLTRTNHITKDRDRKAVICITCERLHSTFDTRI